MNPLLAKLRPCPFESLRRSLAGVTPNPAFEFTLALQREYNVLVLPGTHLSREAHGETPGKGYLRVAL